MLGGLLSKPFRLVAFVAPIQCISMTITHSSKIWTNPEHLELVAECIFLCSPGSKTDYMRFLNTDYIRILIV